MNSIVFWNCRGAKKKKASLYLKEIVKEHKAIFVGLLETKLSFIHSKEVNTLIGTGWDFNYVPSAGLLGGILVMWKSRMASFKVIDSSSQFIIGDLDIPLIGKWRIATSYGSKEVHKRRDLWIGLYHHISIDFPLIIGGDFNCLLAKEEKKGGRRFIMSSGPKDMKSFLISNNLYELKFMGPMFTWSNNKKGLERIMERLDRMIINSYSVNTNQLLVVKHLPRIASDHCPILLNLNSSSPKISKSFKFENIWASYPASFLVVQNVWNRKAIGSPSDMLNTKMRRTMKSLYFWSRSKHQNLEQLKENLKKEILQLQEKEARNGLLTSEEICLLKFKIGELNSTLARLSTWWKQRAKVKWINEGDQNSKFFHSFASARRNVNFIASIKDELGILVDKKNEIEEVLIQYFRNKWYHKNCILTDWPKNSKCLDNEDILILSKDVSIDEVEEALKGTSDCTAPGEYGVSYFFFKNYWPIIKADLWKAIQIFLLTADMNKNWKKTQIVINFLIPKLISLEQASFIKGRTLHDHILIAQELLSYAILEMENICVRIRSNSPRISNLLYADDVMVFAEAKITNVKVIKEIIKKYCNWTGHKVNTPKSGLLFGKAVNTRIKRKIKNILGYNEVK
ncbi:uncharacterized protein LOC110097240 [Dendrobium catenatum]|uniref:uncharacterized protein LOC110097240 n=1 Tax=Dendrobium catenatum TaxID=906689 RepID=UPI00109FCCE6|nr:uncharacterized protein LOC110097240 [Dendrobium catenatum]